MSSGSWVKFFADDSTEIGSDGAVDKGRASWSRGRLSDITRVQLADDARILVLSVPNTEWHQFDRYAAVIGPSGTFSPNRVARVVQAKIQNEHIGQYLLYNRNKPFFSVGTCDDCGEGYKIIDADAGKWITAVISSSGISLYLAEKGKLDANKQIFR